MEYDTHANADENLRRYLKLRPSDTSARRISVAVYRQYVSEMDLNARHVPLTALRRWRDWLSRRCDWAACTTVAGHPPPAAAIAALEEATAMFAEALGQRRGICAAQQTLCRERFNELLNPFNWPDAIHPDGRPWNDRAAR